MPDHILTFIFCSIQVLINSLNARGQSKNRKNKVFTSIQQ